MTTSLKRFALAFCVVMAASDLAVSAVEPSKYVMCRSQRTVRTLRVEPGPEGCQTVYTKAGIDKVVGSGKNRVSCDNVLTNIRSNLEGAGWKCKEVSGATVSTINN